MNAILDVARSSFEGRAMVGESKVMNEVRDFIARVAPSDAPVMVLGETGTGKEAAARAVHACSRRSQGPFVALNCGSMNDEVLESELFGHVAGAFTGASRERIGHIEEASGGTLFLDEVGDAPARLQLKLLRVLQEKEVVPVGSSRPRKVDVRLVVATHRDLEEQVRLGKVREDFLYRIRSVVVALPPLRERREDLDALTAHFIARNLAPGRTATLSEDARAALAQHPFRGNIRELEMMIIGALAKEPQLGIIETHHLFGAVWVGAERGSSGESAAPREPSWDQVFELILHLGKGMGWAKIKAGLIGAALRHHQGNVPSAARDLGVDPGTLRRNAV